jgi:hypothetical protein
MRRPGRARLSALVSETSVSSTGALSARGELALGVMVSLQERRVTMALFLPEPSTIFDALGRQPRARVHPNSPLINR